MQQKANNILCLDIGNSHIVGGVFHNNKLDLVFRYEVNCGGTSDQIGVFLRNVLHENKIDPTTIKQIAICSVVPHLDYSVSAACVKYFAIEPFMLQPGVKTGIDIKYRNPIEVGADVIAGAVAAVKRYPKQNIIIVDFGTATTICPINAKREFLGGLIFPGLRLCMEALQANTAKLPTVNIVKPQRILGDSTVSSIQSGLYYGQLSAVKEIVKGLTQELFAEKSPIIIGTGGFAYLFADQHVFTEIIPNIVLEGLLEVLQINSIM